MSSKIKEIKGDRTTDTTGDLFPDQQYAHPASGEGPLADRMRPLTLEEFVGQEELMGSGSARRS